jgi:hypothetical protein
MAREPVEGIRPAVAVQFQPWLGLERALGERDLGRLAEVPKRELDEVLDIVWVRVLVSLSDPGTELQARDAEALGPPPLRQPRR